MLRDATHCIVANHPAGHEAVVMAALERGVPVLCEKPLTLRKRDAGHFLVGLPQLFKHNKKTWPGLYVSYPWLWAHDVQVALSILGKASFRATFMGPTKHDYLPLYDWGVHALSLAVAALGKEITIIRKSIPLSTGLAYVELSSARGDMFCVFGESGSKRCGFKSEGSPMSAQCDGQELDRMLAAFLSGEDHWQFDPAITLRVHELLEEICG